ncbi:hypothetical protein E4T66_17160 [Sinimarinibacterium sp. CAU 1509]|uniref:hypothetical protein n=1 Tax=Sinimarinibacterium sp. CAU 1509 TaxID=2562283 RepID=UPI0010AD7A7E|nr:hypothetical protein [Sinimarinibacterium sp. CAU 1509]TJY57140.1 hypothetical protein E4T66_17160 [Sinimarinibacterium sp. CAU 1509]
MPNTYTLPSADVVEEWKGSQHPGFVANTRQLAVLDAAHAAMAAGVRGPALIPHLVDQLAVTDAQLAVTVAGTSIPIFEVDVFCAVRAILSRRWRNQVAAATQTLSPTPGQDLPRLKFQQAPLLAESATVRHVVGHMVTVDVRGTITVDSRTLLAAKHLGAGESLTDSLAESLTGLLQWPAASVVKMRPASPPRGANALMPG